MLFRSLLLPATVAALRLGWRGELSFRVVSLMLAVASLMLWTRVGLALWWLRSDPAAADDIGLLNELRLPVDRTVVIRLTSRDVIHSFTLNEMRVKQDATPGMFARLWFTPTVTGDWEIACSQLCGLGHYRMRGSYKVVPQDEWAGWQRAEVARLAP